ncbi:MAG: DUF4270 family protein, partial [Bacteroidota bacterium]
MKKRNYALLFIAIAASVAIVFSGCKKINEATELGGGLIPPVDNINTFDTTVSVQAFQNVFGLGNDSQYLAKNEEYFLGKISNDQFFGVTKARMFFELKPPAYPFGFLDRTPDSLRIDSVVLILNYLETYGDTNTAQTINVYELDQTNNFRSDTAYLIRETPQNRLTYSSLLGSKIVIPKTLKDSVKARGDTTAGQLRIRLNDNFGTRLLSYDSVSNGAVYSNDSVFRTRFKGFALESVGGGNAVMGFDLTGVNTKLAIYYKY